MIKLWIKDRENSSQAKSLSLFVYSRKLSDHGKKAKCRLHRLFRMIAIITYIWSGKNYEIFRQLTSVNTISEGVNTKNMKIISEGKVKMSSLLNDAQKDS